MFPRSRWLAVVAVCASLLAAAIPSAAQGGPAFAEDRWRSYALSNNLLPQNVALPAGRAGKIDWFELMEKAAAIAVHMEPGPDYCDPTKRGYKKIRWYILEAGEKSSLVVNQARQKAELHIRGGFVEIQPGAGFCDDGSLQQSNSSGGELYMEFATSSHSTPRNFLTGVGAAGRSLETAADAVCDSGDADLCEQLRQALEAMPASPPGTGGFLRLGSSQTFPMLSVQPGFASAPRESLAAAGVLQGQEGVQDLLEQYGVDLDQVLQSVPPEALEMAEDAMGGEASFAGTLADREDPYQPGVPFTLVTFNVGVEDLRLDLTAFRPRVMDPDAGPAAPLRPIADEREHSIGAQTWVNLDNDDGFAGVWDDHPNPSSAVESSKPAAAPSEDNELVKLELSIGPVTLTEGLVELEVPTGKSNVRMWEDPFRKVPFDDEKALALTEENFEKQLHAWVKEVWVEGIEPHTEDRPRTEIKLTYTETSLEDVVSLTVLGVEELKWEGDDNGFEPGSITHASKDLSRSPKEPKDDDKDSDHVFPGGRAGETTRARKTVFLDIELTVPPVEEVTLFARSFDVDDPTEEDEAPTRCRGQLFVDPNDRGGSDFYEGTNIRYTRNMDNRGSVQGGGRWGRLDGEVDRIAPVTFSPSTKKARIEFEVSLHPGDNYRTVVNGDRQFLRDLRNLDEEDREHVVDDRIAGTDPVRRAIREMDHYASNMLTVWRLLHVESDTMKPVPPDENYVEGRVVAVRGGEAKRRVFLSVDLEAIGDGDKSPNLDRGGQGRFEKGSIQIGKLVDGNRGLRVEGNGRSFVELHDRSEISAQVRPPSGSGLSPLSATVVALEGNEFVLKVKGTSKLVTGYVNGSLNIRGWSMEIARVDPPGTVGVKRNTLPFRLRDDDQLEFPNPLPTSALDAFHDAFVLVVEDGGGSLSNNTRDLPFQLHVKATEADAVAVWKTERGSAGLESSIFWVVYLCGAYQPDTYWPSPTKPLGDDDPDSEPSIDAVTAPFRTSHAALAAGGDGSLIYREVARETQSKKKGTEALTIVHEIGHQFGLGHGGPDPSDPTKGFVCEYPDVGLMHDIGEAPSHRDKFRGRAINLIRSRDSSPGADSSAEVRPKPSP